jgi:putative ABC transport system permease protein
VAVRKVLGASIWSVVRTLGREFVLLVLAANVIAWPLGWYAMSRWIRNFVHHTRIGLEVFVVSGPAALGIALVAISLQIYRAAAANPADRLRNE